MRPAYADLVCDALAGIERIHADTERGGDFSASRTDLQNLLFAAARRADSINSRSQLRGDIWRLACALQWSSNAPFQLIAVLGRSAGHDAKAKQTDTASGDQVALAEVLRLVATHSQRILKRGSSVVDADLAHLYALMEVVLTVARAVETSFVSSQSPLGAQLMAHDAEFGPMFAARVFSNQQSCLVHEKG